MASEVEIRPRPFPSFDVWPPDDSEESVLGTDRRQTTITNLSWGINEIAHLRAVPEQLTPWHALSQIALLGCMRVDGTLYRTYPDVFVYPFDRACGQRGQSRCALTCSKNDML